MENAQMIEDTIACMLQYITEKSSDHALAHSVQDNLYWIFVTYIAEQAPEPFCTLAKSVLASEEIDFPRYYK